MATPSDAPKAVIKTLFLTDLVDSTRLFERLGDERAAEVSGDYDRVARGLLDRFHGREIDKTDGFLLLFDRPIDATRYALAYQSDLIKLSERTGVPISGRVGIHLGEVFLRENSPEDVARGAKPLEVEGLAKHTVARVASLARGGQTLLTQGAFDLARRAAVGETVSERPLGWLAHGPYVFKGIAEPLDIFEVGEEGVAPLSVPQSTEKARRAVTEADELTLGWRPATGLDIPQRANWLLANKLGEGGFGEVWLATHKNTGEQRVFKFCFQADRLRALRREVTLFRLLKEALGNRDDIARVLDWQFDEAPYFLESEYTEGGSLVDWAHDQGGLAQIPLPIRLELIAQVGEALGAAHSVGVLHKDIKPANILIATDREGTPRIRLADFGIGLIQDKQLLLEKGITAYGLTLPNSASTGGTHLYMAPELVEGKVGTVQADIYALGVMLYQIVVGDFNRALAPGWERDVEDELLREDITALVERSPERRPQSAAEIAEPLRNLEEHRTQLEAERRRQAEAEATRVALEKAQRRRRVFGMIATAASVVLVVVSFLAIQAVRARQDADLRRGQAENLIDFMVGDLRAKLAPIGRLDVLDDVGDKAMEYFASLPADQVDDDELFRRSKTLNDIGDVRIDQGNLEAAQVAFEESLTLAQELAERDPENGEWQVGLGAAHFWVGEVMRRQGDLDGDLRHLRAYLEISEALVEKDLTNLEWQLELGYAHGNVGTILDMQGNLEGALDALRKSLAVKQNLVARDPDNTGWQRDLAVSHSKVGTTLDKMGDLNGALEPHRVALAIRQALVESDLDNTRWRRDLAVSHNRVGSLLEDIGDLEGAIEHFLASLVIEEELVAHDPTNTDWQRDLAVLAGSVGHVAEVLGDLDLAGQHYQDRLRMVEALVETDPKRSVWSADLADTHLDLGRFSLASGQPVRALEEARSALGILEELVHNNPDDQDSTWRLSEAHTLLGSVWAAMGEADRSRASWSRAIEIIEPLARESSDRRLLDPWARPLLYLGRIQEATLVIERLKSMNYRERTLMNLWQARRPKPSS